MAATAVMSPTSIVLEPFKVMTLEPKMYSEDIEIVKFLYPEKIWIKPVSTYSGEYLGVQNGMVTVPITKDLDENGKPEIKTLDKSDTFIFTLNHYEGKSKKDGVLFLGTISYKDSILTVQDFNNTCTPTVSAENSTAEAALKTFQGHAANALSEHIASGVGGTASEIAAPVNCVNRVTPDILRPDKIGIKPVLDYYDLLHKNSCRSGNMKIIGLQKNCSTPKNVQNVEPEAIFLLKEEPPYMTFESVMHRGYFLSFEEEGKPLRLVKKGKIYDESLRFCYKEVNESNPSSC